MPKRKRKKARQQEIPHKEQAKLTAEQEAQQAAYYQISRGRLAAYSK